MALSRIKARGSWGEPTLFQQNHRDGDGAGIESRKGFNEKDRFFYFNLLLNILGRVAFLGWVIPEWPLEKDGRRVVTGGIRSTSKTPYEGIENCYPQD